MNGATCVDGVKTTLVVPVLLDTRELLVQQVGLIKLATISFKVFINKFNFSLLLKK